MEINVNGDIATDADKFLYDFFGIPCICPKDVRDALSEKPEGEKLIVNINSGGGIVSAGQEIYSLLLGRDDVEINIQSLAGSAASVIAMANKCYISPVASIMIHNVSMSGADGNYHDMEKNAEILKSMNASLAESYVKKTGKSKSEILDMMDRETWITAKEALQMGFVDGILNDAAGPSNTFYNCAGANSQRLQLTDKMRRIYEDCKNDLIGNLENYGGLVEIGSNHNPKPITVNTGIKTITLDQEQDIRDYRNLFGDMEDPILVNRFMELKQYAKDHNMERIAPVNEIDLAVWRSKRLADKKPIGTSEGLIELPDQGDTESREAEEKQRKLRKAFDLPEIAKGDK